MAVELVMFQIHAVTWICTSRQAMRQSGLPEDTAEKIFEGFSQESSDCQRYKLWLPVL